VGTYAYVNPVVAVFLGWLILHEAVTARTIAAGVLILGAVLMIQLAPGAHGRSRAQAAELPAAAPRRGEAGA
jgi:drug/metabolite transporter (DMT)-like permease